MADDSESDAAAVWRRHFDARALAMAQAAAVLTDTGAHQPEEPQQQQQPDEAQQPEEAEQPEEAQPPAARGGDAQMEDPAAGAAAAAAAASSAAAAALEAAVAAEKRRADKLRVEASGPPKHHAPPAIKNLIGDFRMTPHVEQTTAETVMDRLQVVEAACAVHGCDVDAVDLIEGNHIVDDDGMHVAFSYYVCVRDLETGTPTCTTVLVCVAVDLDSNSGGASVHAFPWHPFLVDNALAGVPLLYGSSSSMFTSNVTCVGVMGKHSVADMPAAASETTEDLVVPKPSNLLSVAVAPVGRLNHMARARAALRTLLQCAPWGPPPGTQDDGCD